MAIQANKGSILFFNNEKYSKIIFLVFSNESFVFSFFLEILFRNTSSELTIYFDLGIDFGNRIKGLYTNTKYSSCFNQGNKKYF